MYKIIFLLLALLYFYKNLLIKLKILSPDQKGNI